MSTEGLTDPKYDSKSVWTKCGIVSLGSFLFGYNLGVFNSSQESISASLGWGSDEVIFIPMFAGIVAVGAAISASTSGKIADKLGRRKTLLLADIMSMVAAAITCIPFTPTFGIGRFISGLSIGIFAAICPVYINETAPVKIGGSVGGLVQFNVTFGIVIAYAASLPLPTGNYENDPLNNLWFGLFILMIAISAVMFVLIMFFVKNDTPTWYAAQGMYENALESLKDVYNDESAHQLLTKLKMQAQDEVVEMDIVNKSVSPKDQDNREPTLKEMFCSPRYRKMLRLGLCLNFLQQWCGINAILTYSTTIFLEQTTPFMARILTLIVGIVNMAATLLIFPFIQKLGRKKMMLLGEIAMAACLVLEGISSLLLAGTGIATRLVFILLFVIAFETSLGPITWIYCGEIQNSIGMSIAVATNWACVVLVLITFPFLLEGIGISYTFFIFAVICVGGFFYLSWDMKETNGLTKREILNMILQH